MFPSRAGESADLPCMCLSQDVFYSRKNFKRPDLQKVPHRSFDQEVALLNSIFKGNVCLLNVPLPCPSFLLIGLKENCFKFSDGSSYCLGDEDSECWYLYTLHPSTVPRPGIPNPDQTLEILMSDLDPKVMSIFTKANSSSACEATKVRMP